MKHAAQFLLPMRAGLCCAFLFLAGCDLAKKPPPPPPAVVKPSLHEAAASGDLALVQEWVTGGADVAAADAEGLTPLHRAASAGHLDIVRFLLLNQAPIEASDAEGNRALHLAARSGQRGAVELLLDGGADVVARNHDLATAYDLAVQAQRDAVAALLAARGGAPAPEPTPEPELVATPPPTLLTGASFRVWTSLAGAQIEAEFVRSQFDMVQLRKRDSTLVQIRLALLKPEDQILSRQLAGLTPPRLVRKRGLQPAEPNRDSVAMRIGRDKSWQVLTDCRYLKREGNDGDSFHVRHDGKEYIFRLYYVDCPETSLLFPDRVREQADYFRVGEQDIMRIGDEAKRFTEGVLTGVGFTVITKWEDARGNSSLPRYYAFVVSNQGDLDELLAAEGLARLFGMRVGDSQGERKQSVLQELERDARREGAGAWGLDQHAKAKP